jgi:hypothetical protein
MLMRGRPLLIGSLVLILGACSGKGVSHAPPPLDKELLKGKWKNISAFAFVAAYDFRPDGSMKVTFQSMKEPLPCRYTWTGERTLEVEYPDSADLKKAYENAAKDFKDSIKDKIARKDLDGKAGPSIMGVIPDQLPEKEAFTVGISDPQLLVLVRKEEGGSQNFERVD